MDKDKQFKPAQGLGSEKYRFLLEQSMDMVYLHDLEGRIREVSSAAQKWTGYSEAELLQMTIFDFDPGQQSDPDQICASIEAFRCMRSDSGPVEFEIRQRRKDGSLGLVRLQIKKIKLGDEELIMSIARDIGREYAVQSALEEQTRFEKLVSGISAYFLETPADKLGDAINYALQVSGEYFEADRSYICRFSDDFSEIFSIYEWCAKGIESVHDRNQFFPTGKVPWWTEKLKTEEIFFIPDVLALPPEATLDREDFLVEKIKSVLTVTLNWEGKTFGYFGFDAVKAKKDWSGDQVALLKVVADIISSAIFKARAEEELKESRERYRDILATMEEGYYESDLAGIITYCNSAACRLFGYRDGELVGISYHSLYKDPQIALKTFCQVFKTGKPEKGLILEMIRKDREIRYGEISISLIKDKEGYAVGFKGIGKDVTDRVEYEKRLKYFSLHDQLTGIYNRAFFETELNRLQAGRNFPITIVSVDLDGLKLVNDTMGHSAGDRLLQQCADIMVKALRQDDIVARVGGDEFSALLPGTDREAGEGVVKRIRELERRNKYKTRAEDIPLGLSVGVATAEQPGSDLKELFKKADDLMYRDKLYRSSSSRSKIVQSLLAALAERDYITEGHARRLEELCRAVGDRINLPSHQLADLALLAQVHDLGKVGIPDKILFKAGPLDAEEWEVMRGHPEKGCRIATSSPDLAGVAELILKHHERFDGKGYPLGLKGLKIPVECRILAIVDAYDAMTSKRPYNKARTIEEAVVEIKKNAGSQFDPSLARVFLEVLKEKCEETSQA